MPKIITSMQNATIKQVASLLQKKQRKEQNAFLLEGFKCIQAAVKSGFPIKQLFFEHAVLSELEGQLLIEIAKKQGTALFQVPQSIINRLSDSKTPQPIVAVLEDFSCKLSEIQLPGNAMVLVLDGINDPGNLGTIIRTADAFGIEGVILNQSCADIFSPKTLRATMGSLFHLPVIVNMPNQAIVTWLQENSFQIAASAADAQLTMQEANFSSRTALIMGSEAHGVSDYFFKQANFKVSIPMKGRAESLNVAIATALLLYSVRG